MRTGSTRRIRLRTARVGLSICAAAIVVAFGLTGASSASAQARGQATAAALRLPVPTGPYRVGTVSLAVPDTSRPGGETMIQLFYPTLARHARPAAYLTPKTAVATAAALHVPLSVVRTIVTHAYSAPRAAPGARPVVLFSPGLTELRSDDTALDIDLASRGFVVVAIDHPTEAAVVEFPDGRLVRGSFTDSNNPVTSAQLRAAAVQARVRDVAAVTHALAGLDRRGLLRDRLDLTRIGMFGFSIGGATTDEAMRALQNIRAGVDLDGSLYGRSLTTPLHRPFLLLVRDGHSTSTDPSLQQGWAKLRGYRREIRLIGAGHGDFSDIAGLYQQYIPGFTDPSGYIGPIPATRATAAVRQLLTAFFDHTLLGQHQSDRLLNHPAPINHHLIRLR